jgi:ketosteroid isomerase-like protein
MTPDREKDEAAVRDWVDSYFSARASSDLDEILPLLAEDVIFLPPNRHSIHGVESWKESIKPGLGRYVVTFDVGDVEIDVDSNLACVRLELRERYRLKEGGETTVVDFKGLCILRRGKDDVWKMTRNIWNHNPSADE